ncbi:MAG: hypothetical protein Q7R45_04615, partial [Sulfuricaulis sp.]|nr:hypothetical protein [Sulfuricaulis sp.]
MDRPLKAYAAKRRQDAGAPLELHPATSRMLQAEAARQTPRARGAAQSWAGLLTGWLPRLAGAAVLCAFLGLIGWMLWRGIRCWIPHRQLKAIAPDEAE